ncbi:hypothetical protein QP116_07765 [Pseudoglutamicibacter cumminsii]|uniref:Uncharacterized protein n=1 Tax=Pseudoglutamicibacter cumminsii TaxID=156979 RepID=A0AAP4FF39_9MICC|nr:hypothetical protein [Pseudoglutamicibacter cumminsii]MDK6275623.1 hypothetical protein [Pseudoglutamicibacter cumminsii]
MVDPLPNDVPAGLTGASFARVTSGAIPFLISSATVSEAEAQWLCDDSAGLGAAGVLTVSEQGNGSWKCVLVGASGAPVPELEPDAALAVATYLDGAGQLASNGSQLEFGSGEQYTVARSRGNYKVAGVRWSFAFPQQAQSEASDGTVHAEGLPVARPCLTMTVGAPVSVVALADVSELEGLRLDGHGPQLDSEVLERSSTSFVVPHDPLVDGGIAAVSMRFHHAPEDRAGGPGYSAGQKLSREYGSSAAAAVAGSLAFQYWAGAGRDLAEGWAVSQPTALVGVRLEPGSASNASGTAQVTGPARVVANIQLS